MPPEVVAAVRILLLSSDQRVPQVRLQIAFDSDDSARRVVFGKQSRTPGRKLSAAKFGEEGCLVVSEHQQAQKKYDA